MVESPLPDHLTRRATLLGGAAILASAATTVGFEEAAYAGIGDRIRRSKVMDRARTWVRRGIQYSQSGTAADAERNHRYRRDCSGYISMCWHTRRRGLNAHTTWTLPNISTRIRKSNLRRGDILCWPHHHAVLFHKWANTAHTRFYLYEMANPTSDMNHRVAYLSSFRDYRAYRYNRIVDG